MRGTIEAGSDGAVTRGNGDADKMVRRVLTSTMLRKVAALVTTTSALSDRVSVLSDVTMSPALTRTMRLSTLKFNNRNVNSAVPAGTAANP